MPHQRCAVISIVLRFLSWLVRLTRRRLDQTFECLIEGLAAQVEPDDRSLGVDQVGRGDRAHAEALDQVGRAARVVELRPGEVAGLGEIDDGRLGLVQADADDLEAGVVIGAVGRLQPRQLGDAGRAPGRPEIDQDVLAAVGVEANGAVP